MSPDAGYSGTPLPRKLGVKAGHQVLLDQAPTGFALDPLPDGVVVRHDALERAEHYDVALVFCLDAAALEERWSVVHPLTAKAGGLWVAWPKRAAKIPTDLDENVVRAYGLTHGRVDVKVCAVDAKWSALKFVVRLADR
jgi:hypothetical protein